MTLPAHMAVRLGLVSLEQLQTHLEPHGASVEPRSDSEHFARTTVSAFSGLLTVRPVTRRADEPRFHVEECSASNG